jgi:hypothetical protein
LPGLSILHHQRAIRAARFARKIELGGKQLAALLLQLDVDVARPAHVRRRQVGLEAVAALRIGAHQRAVAVTRVVVLAVVVGVPEVERHVGERLAVRAAHHAAQHELSRL